MTTTTADKKPDAPAPAAAAPAAAPAPPSDSVTLTIDGQKLTVKKGTLLVEAAKQLQQDIPVFCYHPKLKPVGACRMCLVEIEKMPRLQTACTTPVAEGMVVKTKSDMATGGQNAVVSLLLANHPLDCPVCDKGGECPLQDNTFEHGLGVSRFEEEKRHKDKAFELSDRIVLDRERCIMCYRCVRFHEEVPGDRSLAVIERGSLGQIGVLEGEAYNSPFQGNVVDICPVGALTSRQYRFRSRPWDLKSAKGIAADDPTGSNLFIDSRDGRVLRLRPRENPAINDAWLADKTRYETVPAERSERLGQPLVRPGKGQKLAPATWFEAVRKAGNLMRNNKVGVLVSPAVTNEALGVLAEGSLGELQVWPRLSAWPVTGTLKNLATSKSIVVVGCDPWHELPMLALQIRKALVPFTSAGISTGGGGALVVVGAENGLFRDTKVWLKADPKDLVDRVLDLCAALEGKGSAEAQAAAAALKERPASIVAGAGLAGSAAGLAALEKLKGLLGCTPETSFCGAVDGSANARGVRDIVAAAVTADIIGKKDVYVVVGDVPHQPGLALKDPGAPVVWLTASLPKDGAGVPDFVDIVLPLAHVYEQAGSFTNLEGVVQGFDAGGVPPGGADRAKPDYEAAAWLVAEMGVAMPKDLKGLRSILSARFAFFKTLQNRATVRSELTVV